MVRDFRGDPDVIRGEFAIVALPPSASDSAKDRRSKRHTEAQRKLRLVVESRLAGESWEDCARKAGYANSGTAFRVFHAWLDKIPQESIERYRRVMIMRLDRALNGIWRWVDAGMPAAIDRMLAIEALRARVLGLDKAPPGTFDETDPEVLALAKRYSGLSSEEVVAEAKRLDWVAPSEPVEEAG